MNAIAAPAGSESGCEYRLSRANLWIGLICSVSFLGMGVLSTWAAWTNVDGSFRYPKEITVFFASFWGMFTLLGIYLIRAYYVERLLVWEDRVRVIGSLRTREVRFTELSEARWRGFPAPGGSLVLRTFDGKAVIHFGAYAGVDVEQLKEFFRGSLPAEAQIGWEKHDETYRATPARAKKNRKARRWAHIFLGLVGAGFIALGVIDPFNNPGERWTHLVVGIVNVVFVSYMMAAERRILEGSDRSPEPDQREQG